MSTTTAPALGWRIKNAGMGTLKAGLPLSRARSSFSFSKRPPGRSIIERDQVTWPATIGSTLTVAPGVPPASGSCRGFASTCTFIAQSHYGVRHSIRLRADG